MVDEDLANFRAQLKVDFNDVWDDLSDLIGNMKSDFDEQDRAMFKACTDSENGYPNGNTIGECLEAAAEEVGVAEEFRRRLSDEDLINDLRSMGRSAARDNNVSAAVRSAANFAKDSELKRMCAQNQFGDVEDELSDLDIVQGSIDSYADCMTAASEASNLRADLKDAYGTSG